MSIGGNMGDIFAALQPWLNWGNQGLSEFNTEKLNDMEQIDLYTLLLAATKLKTDAERLAMAVLKGDTSAALALADMVSEEWKARSDAETKGEPFVSRRELIEAARWYQSHAVVLATDPKLVKMRKRLDDAER